jgi:hypothetical protein
MWGYRLTSHSPVTVVDGEYCAASLRARFGATVVIWFSVFARDDQ